MQVLLEEYRGIYSKHIEMIHTRIIGKLRTYRRIDTLIEAGLVSPRKGAKIKPSKRK